MQHLWPLTSQSKLSNYEKGTYYLPPLLLMQLCEDYGLTMDWFYRRVRSGVPESLPDKLRGAEASEGAHERSRA